VQLIELGQIQAAVHRHRLFHFKRFVFLECETLEGYLFQAFEA
jgi:hypothetical protein